MSDITLDDLPAQHVELVANFRFKETVYNGVAWDFQHLKPFAFREEIEPGLEVDVVVFFSCHCFTHGHDKDIRPSVPKEEIYLDGSVRRVLNPERYELSRRFMPQLVQQLKSRQIRVLGGALNNYATFEVTEIGGATGIYAVFFDVRKDRARKKRLILRIESAYAIDSMTRKQKDAKKVRLQILLKSVYNGKPIRP